MKKTFFAVFFSVIAFAQRIDTSFVDLTFPFKVRAHGSNLFYQNGKIVAFLAQKGLFSRVHILAADTAGNIYFHKKVPYRFFLKNKMLFVNEPPIGNFYGMLGDKFWFYDYYNLFVVDFRKRTFTHKSFKKKSFILWDARILQPFTSFGNFIAMVFPADSFPPASPYQLFGKESLAEIDSATGNLLQRFGRYPEHPEDSLYLFGNWFVLLTDTTEQPDKIWVQYGFSGENEGILYVYSAPKWDENFVTFKVPAGYFFAGVDEEFVYFTHDKRLIATDKSSLFRKQKEWNISFMKNYSNRILSDGKMACIPLNRQWYSNGFHFEKERKYLQFYQRDITENNISLEIHTIYFE